MAKVTVTVSSKERDYHSIFQFGFVKFQVEEDTYGKLAELLESFSLDPKFLNPLASKLFELARREIKEKKGRERRVTTTVFDPKEYKAISDLLDLLKSQDLERVTFFPKRKNASISVTEDSFLLELKELILTNHDPLITAQIKEFGEETKVVRNQSRLVAEELDEFLPKEWPAATRKRFIRRFYKLVGITLSPDALKKRIKRAR